MVALDQPLESEPNGGRARCDDAFADEPVDLAREALLDPCDELSYTNSIAFCNASSETA